MLGSLQARRTCAPCCLGTTSRPSAVHLPRPACKATAPAPTHAPSSLQQARPGHVASPLGNRQCLVQQRTRDQRSQHVLRALPFDPLALGLFFAPGAGILAYAFVKGKGNLTDGLSRLLTDVSQGYFQPDVGGKNIPVSQGELSDLAGDEPLFKALYKWYVGPGVHGRAPLPRAVVARRGRCVCGVGECGGGGRDHHMWCQAPPPPAPQGAVVGIHMVGIHMAR